MGEDNSPTWITRTYNTLKKCAVTSVILGISLILHEPIAANPMGGQISAGAASIVNSGNTTTIHQATDKVVIDWRTFNISPSETTRFNQPSASSIALNRVNPNFGSSQIYGTLTANGNVWILNPAGIVFGKGAQVNVGGLLATTAEISNADFMKGNYQFKQNPNFPNGAVINNGSITVRQGGMAALVAPGVENNGIITANLGRVALASGNKYTVDLYGDNLIHFGLDSEIKQPGKYADGTNMKHAVSNSGTIIANGGKVQMTVSAAKNVVDKAINMSGVIEAKGVYQRGGTIVLAGGNFGAVSVTGKINASNTNKATAVATAKPTVQVAKAVPKMISIPVLKNAQGKIVAKGATQVAAYKKYIAYLQKQQNQKITQQKNFTKLMQLANADTEQFVGGDVIITGEKIALDNNALIDVSGTNGGGNINIGGGYQGKDPNIQNATNTYVGPNVQLHANAIQTGNGGNIIVWSDKNTQFHGSAYARGGEFSGNGGLVETSGKENLSVGNTAYVNTLAPKGKVGDWLLDPKNIIVATGGTGTLAQVDQFGDTPAADITIAPATINAAASNVTLQANNDITFTNAINMTNAGVGLTAQAGRSILINANITTNAGAITMTANDSAATVANRDAGAGDITMANGTTLSTGFGITNAPISLTVGSTATGGFTPGNITLANINNSTSGTGNVSISTPNAISLIGTSEINSLGTVNIAANTDGSGADGFSTSLGGISSGTGGVIINVNSALGGTGSAAVGRINFSGATNRPLTILTNTGGNITGGSITQTSGTTITAGNTSLGVGNSGSITLNSNVVGTPLNNFTGTVTVNNNSANSGNVTISDSAGGIIFGTSSFGTGALSVLANNGNITQTVGSAITMGSLIPGTTSASFAAGTGSISLTNSGNSFVGPVGLSGNNIALTQAQSLTLGPVSFTGTLAITSGGQIEQTGAINQTGTGAISLGSTVAGTNIKLATQANNLAGPISFTTTTNDISTPLANISDFELRNDGTPIAANVLPTNLTSLPNLRNLTLLFDKVPIAFPNVTLTLTNGGNLIARTGQQGGAGGSITATNALIVPGTTTITAGTSAANSGQITLTNAANNFGQEVSLNNFGANNVAITDANALKFTASNLGSGTFTVNATGANDITQIGVITQASGAGAASFTTGAGAITLDLANDFTGPVSLNNTGASTAVITDSNSLQLGTSSLGSGTLNISVGGTLSQNGIITDTGGTTTITATASSTDINLSSFANNFTGGFAFGGTTANIRDFQLRNVNAAAAVPTLSGLANLRNLTIIFDNASVALPVATLSGNLSATSGTSSITQSGALTVPGTSTFTAATDINLINAANNFTGAVSLNNTGLNPVAITDVNAIRLGNSNVGSGTLTVNASGGIDQLAGSAITQAANALTATFNAGAGAILLDNTANDFTGAVATSNSGANNITLRDANNLILGSTNLGGTGNLILNAVGNVTQTGIISGNGGVVKNGAGTATFSLANTYSGATTINSGILSISADNNLGTAPLSQTLNHLTLNGGTLASTATFPLNPNRGITLNVNSVISPAAATTLTYNGNIQGAGALRVGTGGTTGTLELGGTNTYAGTTTISSNNTLKISSNSNLGAPAQALIFDAGGILRTGIAGGNTLTLATSGTNRPITLNGAGIFIVENSTAVLDIPGTFSGTGGFQVNNGAGTGIVRLSNPTENANIFGGSIAVFNGTLQAGNKNVFNQNNAMILGSATFDLNGFDQITGTLQSGTPTSEVKLGGATYKINQLSNPGAFAGSITGSGSIEKLGGSTLVLGKANTYTGSTTVTQGTLANAIANALPSGTLLTVNNGGTYDLGGFSQTVGGLAGTAGGIVTNSGAAQTLTIANSTNGYAQTFAGNLTGALGLTLNLTGTGTPTQTLSSANSSYTGATTITSGRLSVAKLANSASNSSIGTGSTTPIIEIGSNGILQYTGTGDTTARAINLAGSGATIDASGSGALTLQGNITGANNALNLIGSGLGTINSNIQTGAGAALTKSGTGTWTLGGTNTFTGNTLIQGGSLNLTNNNAIASGGGTITVDPNANLNVSFAGQLANTTNTIFLSGTGISNGGALTQTGSNISILTNPISLLTSSKIAKIGTSGGLTLNNAATGISGASGANLTISSDAAFVLPKITLSGGANLAVTTNGATGGVAISQLGVITVPGTATFTAGTNAATSGAISLDTAANVMTGTLSLTNFGNTNNISVINSPSTTLGTTSAGNNFTILTGGSLTQTASSSLTVPGTLSISAPNGITLTNDNVGSGFINQIGGFTANSSSGSISLVNHSANLAIADDINSSGNINITNYGNIELNPNIVSLDISSTGGGNLDLNAIGGSFISTPNSGTNLLLTSTPGNITLTANTMNITNTQIGGTSLNTGSAAKVTLKESTPGRTIGVGTGATGDLSITQALLNNLRAVNTSIGSGSSGLMNIGTANIAGTLTLNGSSSGITQTSGGGLTSPNLILRGLGNIALTGSNNNLTNLAAATGGDISLANTLSTLTVSTLNDGSSVAGITTPGAINLTTTGTGGIVLNNNVASTNGGNINLTTNASSIDIVNGSITTTGDVTLSAYNLSLLGLGTIQESGTGIISANTLNTISGSNTILNNINIVNRFIFAAPDGGDVHFINNNPTSLTLGLGANSNTANAITIQNTGDIRIAATSTVSSAEPAIYTSTGGKFIMETNSTLKSGISTITINASDIQLASGASITGVIPGTANLPATITLNPTNGTAITFGGNTDVPGTFSLTAAEANAIQGKNIILGNNNSGAMTVNEAILASTFGTQSVTLQTGSAGITHSGALTINSTGSFNEVTNGGPITVNANITSANNAPIQFSGFTTANPLTINNGIVNSGSGTITVNGGTTGLLKLTNDGQLTSTGIINLIGDAILQNTSVDGSTHNRIIANKVYITTATNGAPLNIATGSSFPTTALNAIYAPNVNIGNGTSGNISIGNFAPAANFATNTLTLEPNSSSSITQTGALDLSSGTTTLVLRNANNVDLTNPGNIIPRLAANLTAPMQITTTGALNVNSVTDATGLVNGISNITGTTTLTSSNSTIGQAPTTIINTPTLITSSVGGTTLTNNNLVTDFSATNSGGGAISFTNAAPLNIASGITQNNGGNINLTTTGTNDLTFSTSNININGGSGNLVAISGKDLIFAADVTNNNGNISGTGTNVTVNAGNAVKSATGTLQFLASNINLNNNSLLLAGDGSGNNGTINLITDNFAFNANSQVGGTSAGSGSGRSQFVILQPLNSTTIGIGSALGGLTLSNTVLNTIRADAVRIGNDTTTNSITVGAFTLSADFAFNTLSLQSSGEIEQTQFDSLNLGNRGLLLRSGGNIGFDNASNQFAHVAAITSSPVSNILIAAASNLNVASLTDDLGPLNGISIPSNSTGNVTLQTTSPLVDITQSASAPITTPALFIDSRRHVTLNSPTNAIAQFNVNANVSGIVTLTNSIPLSIAIQNGNNVIIQNSSNISQHDNITANSLNTTSAGGTDLTGNNSVGTFSATNTGSGDIDFNNTGALILGNISQLVGNVNISSGTMTINGNIDTGSSHSVNLTSTGSIIEGTGTIKTNTLNTISANGTNLNNANTIANFEAFNSDSGNITLSNSGPLNINAINQSSGDLTINNTGSIGQTGSILVNSGLTSLGAGTLHDITLLDPTNDFQTLAILSARDVKIRDTSSLEFGTSVVSRNLEAIAEGFEQSGILTVLGTSKFNSDSSINLNLANNFTDAVSLNNTGNNPVTLRNASDLILDTSSLGSGTLTVSTDIGSIIQEVGGAITQAPNADKASFTAGTFANSGDITLDAANNFTGLVSVTNYGSNDATINNVGSINLDTSSVGNNLTVTAGGTITQNGALTVPGLLSTNSVGETLLSNTSNNISNFSATKDSTLGDIELANNGSPLTLSGITNPNGNVTISNPNTNIIIAAGVNTALGSQTYNGPVQISAPVTLTASGPGSLITFNNAVNSLTTTPQDLTIAGNVDFKNFVGGTNPLANLTVNGTAILNFGVTTTGDQTYANAVTLNTSVSLTGNNILFNTLNSTIDGVTNGGQNLTTIGAVQFAGVVGVVNPLNSITTSGPVNIGNNINTTLSQNYLDSNVILSNDVTLTTLPGSEINFSTIDGAFDLTLNSNIVFQSNVGGATPLASLFVAGNSIINSGINTTGDQTYVGAIAANNLNLNAGTGDITALNSANDFNSIGLTANNADIFNNHGLTLDGTNITGNLNIAVQTGDISQSGSAITVAGNTIFFTNNGDINFVNTPNSFNSIALTANTAAVHNATTINLAPSVLTNSLNITVDNGNITQSGIINMTAPLATATFIAGAGGNIILDTANNAFQTIQVTGNNVAVKNNNTIDLGATAVSGHYDVTSNLGSITQSAPLDVNGTLTTLSATGTTLNHLDNTIGSFSATNTTSGDIQLNNNANVGSPLLLTLGNINQNADGNILITNNGDISNLDTINTTNDGNISLTANNGTIYLGNDITAGGLGNINLNNSNGISVNADVNLTGNTVTFQNSVNSDNVTNRALTVTGNADFTNTVGSSKALSNLTVTGTTRLNGDVNTTGNQNYNGAVTLNNTVLLTGTTVNFGNSIETNGVRALSIAGDANFGGIVGSNASLSSLSVSGTSGIYNNITTTGDQTYTGAVTLNGDALLVGVSIGFGDTINGAHNLTISGNPTFASTVGNLSPLTSLTINGSAGLNGDVITTGNQNYNSQVTLNNDVTLTAATVNFSNTLNGAQDLVIDGDASFAGTVGSFVPLNSLTVLGDSGLGAPITTTQGQVYTGAVTLNSNVNLLGNNVLFGSTVDGAHNLTISSNAAFDGIVGGTAPLNSLTVSGTTDIASNISTSGDQTYNNSVNLSGDAILAAGNVIFNNTLDGNHNLSILGNVDFGTVGNNAALASLEVIGNSNFSGNVTTSGDQTYLGDMHLDNNFTLQTILGDITLGGGVISGSALNLAGTGSNNSLQYATDKNTTFTMDSNTTGTITNADITNTNVNFSGFNEIVSGIGNDTLVATNGSNTWNIKAAANDSGDLNGLNYANIENLTGGTGNDNFVFENGATISGSINGGNGGTNILNFSAYNTAIDVALNGATAFGYNGTTSGSPNPIGDGFSNINQIDQSSSTSNTLTLDNVSTTVTINNVLTNFFNLTLDDGVAAPLTIERIATVIGGTGTGVENSLISAENTINNWLINGNNSGTYNNQQGTLAFSNFANLTGGTGDNTFNFNGGSISGTLTTGNATNTLSGNVVAGDISTGTGITNIDAASVTTSGNQDYNGATTLNSDAILTATKVNFASTLNGAQDLIIDADASFGGTVGGVTPLNSLTVLGDSELGGPITTTQGQTYTGAVTLNSLVNLTANNVLFGSIVDGAHDLIIQGNADFDAAVGSNTALNSLTVTGTTQLSGNVTTTGNQTYQGAVTAPVAITLDSGNSGNIVANNVNNNFTTLGLVANNADIADANSIELAASNISGELNVSTTAGNITDSGNLTVGGLANFSAGSGGSIALDQNNDFSSVALNGGSVTIRDNNNLNFDNVSAVTLSAITNGDIQQVLGTSMSVLTGTTLEAGSANDIALMNDNDFGSIGITSAQDVALNDVNGLSLGASTISGTLDVTTGGAITQLGGPGLSVTGASTFDAGANNITLNGSNNFSSIGIINGNNVVISDTNGLDLSASNILGTLDVTAGGNITNSAPLVVGGVATFAVGSGNDISLDQDNDFSTARIISGRNVSINDIDNLNLGASTISGNLNVTAAGEITQSGSLLVNSGTSTFDASDPLISATYDINLNNSGNQFNTVGIIAGNDVTLRDTGNLILAASDITGDLNVTTTGNITQSGAITAPGTSTFTTTPIGIVTLNNGANDFDTISIPTAANITINDINDLNFANVSTSGNFAVTADGDITQNTGTGITVSNNSTFDAGINNDITLGQNNNFNTIALTNANDVIVRDLNTLTFGKSNITGNLDVTTNGSINQIPSSAPNDGLTVAGTATFNAGATTNNILLTNTQNDFNVVGITAGNNVTLRDLNALEFAASTISGTLNVITAGDITQSGALTVTGNSVLNAGAANDINLMDSNNFANIVINGANDVSINDINNLSLGFATIAGDYNVTTGGNITQNGATTLEVGGTSTFNSNGNNITLGNNNDFATVAFTSGNNVIVRDINNLDIGASNISGTLGVTTNDGAITQSGTLAVGGNATFTANNVTNPNDITLLDAANDFSSVTISNASDVKLRDANAITLNASSLSNDLEVTAPAGITLAGNVAAGGNQTYNNAVVLSAPVTLTGDTVTFANTVNGNQALAIAGNAVFNSAVGNLTPHLASLSVSGTTNLNGNVSTVNNQTYQGAVSAPAILTLNATNGNITANNPGNDFSTLLIFANNANIADVNAISLGNSFLNETLAVNAKGAITGSGIIGVLGQASFTAEDGVNVYDINLNNPNNNFSTIALKGDTASVVDSSGLTLANTILSGNLSIIAGGNITQSGVITTPSTATVHLNSGSFDITLNNAANDFNNLSATGRDVTLSDINGLNLYDINASNFTVNTMGNLTQEAGTTIVVADLTKLTAGTNDIGLDKGNNFGSMEIVSANNVTLLDINALHFTNTSTISGDLDITTGGTISQNGALKVTGDSIFAVTPSFDINLTNAANDFVGKVRITTARNANFTDINAFKLDNSTISGNLNILANGDITQELGTAVSVAGNTTLSAGAGNDITLLDTANNFTSVAINSARDVKLRDANAITLNTSSLSNDLEVTAPAGITLAGNVAAGGNQTYNNAVVLSAPVTLTGDTVTFANTVNGNQALAIAGNAVFNSAVGNLTPHLASLSVSGTTQLGGNVTTSGVQTYNGALTLNVPVISLTSASGGINFNSTIAGANPNYALHLLGGNAVSSLLGSAGGNTTLWNINGTNSGTISGDAILNNTTVTFSGFGTLLGGTGADNFVFQGTGSLTGNIEGDSGSINTLNYANATMPVFVDLATGTASQINGNFLNIGNLIGSSLNDVLLGSNNSSAWNINAADSGNVSGTSFASFENVVTGDGSNTLNFNGGSLSGDLTTGNGTNTLMGNVIAANLTTGNSGSTVLNANSITTSGDQNYNNAVTLASANTLTADNVTFNSTLNGNNNLTIDTGATGDITFNGNVGGIERLGQLTVANANNVTNNAHMNLTALLQQAGSNLTSLGNNSVNVLGNSSFTTNNVIGHIDTGALTLSTNFANLTGSVAGLSGAAGANQIVIDNTITPGTHFFDGIDLTAIPVPPTPPTPPVPPTPPTPVNPIIPDIVDVDIDVRSQLYPYSVMSEDSEDNYTKQTEKCAVGDKSCFNLEVKLKKAQAGTVKQDKGVIKIMFNTNLR